MDAPGVTLIPIITIDGKHVLNEVLFDNVKVPEAYRIGEEGKGWTYSQYLLGFERTSYARIGGKRAMLRHARELASSIPNGGNHRLIDDAAFARKLTEAEMAVDGLEMTVFRVLSGLSSGGSPGDAASTIKILATQTHQQITELFLDTAAAFAQPGFGANGPRPQRLRSRPVAETSSIPHRHDRRPQRRQRQTPIRSAHSAPQGSAAWAAIARWRDL